MPSGKFQQGHRKASKLTPAEVHSIRQRYEAGLATQGQLARDHCVSVVQVGRIVRYECWTDIIPLKTPEMLQEAAGRLLKVQEEGDVLTRIEAEIQRQKDEATPGRTQADFLLAELGEEATDRLKKLKGE